MPYLLHWDEMLYNNDVMIHEEELIALLCYDCDAANIVILIGAEIVFLIRGNVILIRSNWSPVCKVTQVIHSHKKKWNFTQTSPNVIYVITRRIP